MWRILRRHALPTNNSRSFAAATANSAARKKIAIVGGGVAGLQTAKVLSGHGHDCTIYEKSSAIGGVWRSNYSNFGLQVPKQLYEFPDFPFVECSSGYFPKGEEVQSYIQRYATSHNLNRMIQLNTSVELCQPLSSQQGTGTGTGWTITTQDQNTGKKQTHQYDYLVICSGMYCRPNLPQFDGQASFSGKIMHSSEYTDNTMSHDKHVVVVGGAKSAIDIVLESSKVSKRSTIVMNQAHWATPHYIAGFIPFQYVFLSRLGQALVSWYKGAWPENLSSSVKSTHHVLAPTGIMGVVFGIVETLFAFQLGHYGPYKPSMDVVKDFYGYGHLLDPSFRRALKTKTVGLHQGNVASLTSSPSSSNDTKHQSSSQPQQQQQQQPPPPQPQSQSQVVLNDGRRLPCDVLVLATGYEKTYDYFDSPTREQLGVEEDGLYLYRHCLPPRIPNLAFVGSEIATISNIITYALQAEWLAQVLANDSSILPSVEIMEQEIHQMKAWKRSWMPFTKARASLVLLHQIHYHDRLLQDINIPHRRKGANVVAELLMPYQAGDYDGIANKAMVCSH